MPLSLVTGPANAGKARVVLDGVRARAADDPILVVPTGADAAAYRRELAGRGAVFGPDVTIFDGLARRIARRAGTPARAVAGAPRDRLLAAAIEEAGLDALRAAAEAPGFIAATGELVAELQRERVTPQRFAQALAAWGDTPQGDPAQAREIAALYSGYRRRLDALGLVDSELLAWRAIEALAEAPERWGDTPVFLYGFDDLTPLERHAAETLAAIDGVDVTVALTWEEGRAALAGRARTVEALAPLASEHRRLPADVDHYAPTARTALHHLERALFEDDATRLEPEGAVRLLESGGERAEAELAAAEVLALIGRGVAPEEIAVVFRSPGEAAPLVRRVFASYGIPLAVGAPARFGDTALGRGLVALLRCAAGDARADDLLAWLRTPGLLERPELADWLEAEVRKAGATRADQARAIWEGSHWRLDAIDRLAAAGGRAGAGEQSRTGAAGAPRGRTGARPHGLPERALAELERLFAAPRRRRAAVLDRDEALDARALAAAREALNGLAQLAAADPSLATTPRELADALASLDVREDPAPGAVRLLDPLALRARRVRALILCGLQEGAFPRPGRPEPFLPDSRRRELAAASGLALRLREDALDDERALFYACASRPEELLALSYRSSDEEGRPAVRSFFVDDVRDLFTTRLDEERRTRPLAQVTWPLDRAPTERERARAVQAAGPGAPAPRIGPLTDPGVLATLRERHPWPARALETAAGCTVRWLVEHRLRPDSFEPDPEPMARGSAAHRLLESVFSQLRTETDSPRLHPGNLDAARRILHEEIEAARPRLRLSPHPARQRSAIRRLEADLLRYLRKAASEATGFTPAHLELGFGTERDELPPLDLGELQVAGRIDRVDSGNGETATVYDYKGSEGYPVARWVQDGRLQVPLYMLAVRDVLGLDPVAGLYQPIGKDQRARGAVLEGSELESLAVSTDRVDAATLEDTLEQVAARAREVAAAVAAGQLEPSPDTCGYRGECRYPGICRCER
jgi:ATP-dependent helicase/DNAse subunit B